MKNRNKLVLMLIVIFSLLLSCAVMERFVEPTPTPTDIPPTETPLPTETPTPEPEEMPGWQKFEGGGIELWLPDSYQGGVLADDLDILLESLAALGPEFEQMGQIIAQNPEAFIFYALNSSMTPDGFIPNVNVVTEEVMSSVSLELYIQATLSQIPEMIKVSSNEIVTINDYRAGKVDFEYELQGVSVHQVMYIFLQNNTVWAVTYSTSGSDFDQRQFEFEQSINTFKITD